MLSNETTPSDLAFLLGTSLSKLSYVLYGIGTSNLYTSFPISKANGDIRIIRAPVPQLRILQSRMKNHLEQIYKPHIAASAFIRNRGIVYNARKHLKKKVVFNVDLSDFYNKIHFGRVRGLLQSPPYSMHEDTARLIAHLCCVDRILPQGAPTSPIISNMICRRLDRELSLLAKNNRFTYSRYADDITFSSHLNVENDIYDVSGEDALPSQPLLDIIGSNGFELNDNKTRVQFHSQRQVVTGLKVNRIVNVDRRYIRTTKAMIHSLQLDSSAARDVHVLKNGENASPLEAVVHGRVNYIGMVKGVDSSVFIMLAAKFNNLDLPFKVRTSPRIRNKKLEEKLHFSSYQNKDYLEKCVWIVHFEGIEGISLDAQLLQATAFMCEGGRLFTAAHVFQKADFFDYCIVQRINDDSIKFTARVIKTCDISDLAELEIQLPDGDSHYFPNLKFAPDQHQNQGYMVSLLGFPELRPGHDTLSISPCTIINTFSRSTFRFGELNFDIDGGNSGGPVVNAYMQVVGMALSGKSITSDNDTGENYLEGRNVFIFSEHIKNF